HRGEPHAALRVDALGVVQTRQNASLRKDDGGGDDRTGERPSAGLVHARDPDVAPRAKLPFGAVEQGETPELGEEEREGTGGARHGLAAKLLGPLLVDAGGFALALPEVVELGAADRASPLHLDAIDHRGVQGKNALDADPARDLSNGEGFA